MDSCNLTNKAHSHTHKVDIHTVKTKTMPFWPLCCESKAILFKKFRPGHWAGVFIWKNFHPGYRHQPGLSYFYNENSGEAETEPARLTGLI